MKRRILLLVLVVLLAVMAAVPASDTGASLADDSVAQDEMSIGQADESGPLASAGITVTMYAVDDGESCQAAQEGP